MVKPINPYPLKQRDGKVVWIDPKTNKKLDYTPAPADIKLNRICNNLRSLKYWIIGSAIIIIATSLTLNLWFLPYVLFSKERIAEQFNTYPK